MKTKPLLGCQCLITTPLMRIYLSLLYFSASDNATLVGPPTLPQKHPPTTILRGPSILHWNRHLAGHGVEEKVSK